MTIKIYSPDKLSWYEISIGKERDRIWISQEGGEGGDFPVDNFSDFLFEAIDKYYKENF